MPDIEIITDGQSDVITQQQSASVEVESQDEIINDIGTVALYGPKGAKGEKGDNAEIVGVTATVDSNVGTPDVTVTMGGTSTRRTFNFDFENLKGEQGIQGETGQTGATGNGITDITYASSSGLVDTYNVNYTNGNSDTISVTNGADGTDGVGISSISKTGTSGLVDTYTIDYTDGNDTTFTVTNGKDGIDGIDGIDGYSPTATVTKSGDTATISITDKNGTTTETITDGTDGSAATITVGTVTSGSTASVTNSGTSSDAVFDFVLPKGDTGDTGQTGATGNGISSISKTGTSGLVDTYTIDYTNGNDTTFDVTNGKDGTNGQDGFSPTATVSKSGTVTTITITDKNGTTTEEVYDGTGSITDVQVNGNSVVENGKAKLLTNSAYSSSNKIATMSDVKQEVFIGTKGTTTFQQFKDAYDLGMMLYALEPDDTYGIYAFKRFYTASSKDIFEFTRTYRSSTSVSTSVWTFSSSGDSYSDTTTVNQQVNSDWTATSGKAQILNKPELFSGNYNDLSNKPNLATVATSGSYNDLSDKPTIPTVPTTLSSFTDDLGSNPVHTHSQYLTQHQDISGKEDVAKTVNTLATSGTISLTDNSINKITPTAAVTFTLPTVTDATTFHQILVQMNLSTLYSITLGTSYYFNNTAPDLSSTGVYNLIFEYDNANSYWVVGCVSKGAAS